MSEEFSGRRGYEKCNQSSDTIWIVPALAYKFVPPKRIGFERSAHKLGKSVELALSLRWNRVFGCAMYNIAQGTVSSLSSSPSGRPGLPWSSGLRRLRLR